MKSREDIAYVLPGRKFSQQNSNLSTGVTAQHGCKKENQFKGFKVETFLLKKDLCVKIKITRCLQNEKERQETYKLGKSE